MKLNKWLYGAMALGMLAACSNDDIPENNPDNDVKEGINGYVALRINLPQMTATRANDGDPDKVDYADGEAWEYKVENARLILFKTEKETDPESGAVYLASHQLNRAFASTSPANDQISSSSVEAVKVDIDLESEDPYLWALVMLNVPKDLEVPGDDDEGTLTFADYMKKTSSKSFLNGEIKTGTIFMTNAPLAQKEGGLTSPTAAPGVQTLVKLGKASVAIKSTLQEARENVAGCIYVERALAKLTAQVSAKAENITMYDKNGKEPADGAVATKLKVTVSKAEFGVVNINPSSYIVRNVAGFPGATATEDAFAWNLASQNLAISDAYKAPYFRMVGAAAMPGLYNPMHQETQKLYRTYWCKDPNYETGLTGSTDTEEKNYKNVNGGAFYVKENTFTVTNQNYGNSTLAVFKVTFAVDGKNEDLFILNDNHDAIYTSEEDVTSKVYEYILAQDKVKAALKETVKSGVSGEIDFTPFLKVSFSRDDKTGVLSADGITLDKTAKDFANYYDAATCDETFKTKLGGDDGVSALVDRVNNLYIIEKYVGGVSYYMIPIQHFGEVSTPWKAGDKNQTETKTAYLNETTKKLDVANFLGRYGMVRNNWYEINARTFVGIGSPVVPSYKDRKDLSDDNNEIKQYIGIETHILSWAKRLQNADF